VLPIQLDFRPRGHVIAEGVSADDFERDYADGFYEWIRGYVIQMPPISKTHMDISTYLGHLLSAYLALKPIGDLLTAPFTMRYDPLELRPEPDLQLVLHANPGQITRTAFIGAADICIEIVSPESVERDYADKFVEYEAAGVGEYWLIDPDRRRARFYQRGDSGQFVESSIGVDEIYRTPLLPRLHVHIPTFWLSPLPHFYDVAEAVKRMFVD